ncbi:MAG: XdhC/CoxI family protein [Armatimonadota bacterium]
MSHDVKIYEDIVRIIKRNGNAVMAVVVESTGSAPRRLGAKMLISEDGAAYGTVGGGKVELTVVSEAKKLMGTGKSKLLEYDLTTAPSGLGVACGGKMKIFLDDVNKSEQLVVFGGGHIAVPLVNMAKELGFDITVVDDRSDYANKKRFKNVKVVNKGFVKAFEELKINKRTYIVIASYSHRIDQDILEKCLEYDPKYLGMIGSGRKVKTVFGALAKKGINKNRFKKVKSPIGLSIGAETPAEIAVSILAEIVKARCSRS